MICTVLFIVFMPLILLAMIWNPHNNSVYYNPHWKDEEEDK